MKMIDNDIIIITSKESAKCYLNKIYRDLYNIIGIGENIIKGLPKDWLDYCQDELNKIKSIFQPELKEEEEEEENEM